MKKWLLLWTLWAMSLNCAAKDVTADLAPPEWFT